MNAKLTTTQTAILKAAAAVRMAASNPCSRACGAVLAPRSSMACSPEGSSRNLKAATC